MNLRKEKCNWCGKMYVVKDSKAIKRFDFCCKQCEEERNQAGDEWLDWWEEIKDEWCRYISIYVAESDEECPRKRR